MGRTATVVTTRKESGFWAFVWRHRVGLAPIIAGFGIAILGTIIKLIELRTEVATISLLLCGALWYATTAYVMRSAGDSKIHRKREQSYVLVVAGSAIAWMLWYRTVPFTWDQMQTVFVVWLTGVGVLALPYWFNLRRRTRVRLDNALDEWPKISAGTSLAKTRWASFTKTAGGWTGTLTWEKGALSRRRVREEIDLMESLMDAPPESVTIELIEGKGNVNKVKVTCVEDDPHTAAIPFDGVVATSIRDVMSLGKYMDHTEEKTRWWEDEVGGFHRLAAGATRTGKSGLTHLLVAKYGPAADVRPWFADLKGGTALLPWSPIADWTETSVEGCMHMVMAGALEVDRRARICAAKGVEVWEPTEEDPVIIIFFDEIASLIGDSAPNSIAQVARAAVVEIARKGAGMGVLIVPATQYPTLAALGDSQFKSQLAWRACFRLNQPEQGHYVLPSMPKNVDPYRIPKSRRGTCYIDAEGEFRPSMLRVQYVDRGDISRIVERFGRRTSDDDTGPAFLDGIEDDWGNEQLAEVYRARKRWSIQDLQDLKNGRSVSGSDATGDDMHDLDDYDITQERDAMADFEPHEDGNVVAVDFTGYATSEIRQAVDKTLQDDPQRAVREAKEREAWLAERQPVPGNEVERIMFEKLKKAGPEGVSPADLAKATGRTERTIHRYLERQKSSGHVMRLGYGRYRLTVTPIGKK